LIAVTPTTDAYRVLALIAATPGELDASAIAARLYPPPPLALPIGSHAARSAAYSAWLLFERGPMDAQGKRSGGRLDAATAKVSRILGRLQERGLIETRGPPIIAPWIVSSIERDGIMPVLNDAADEDREPTSTHAGLVMRCMKNPPDSAAGLLGPSPSGHIKRAYADLVTWGVIVPPARRWPTEVGLRLLEQT